MIGITLKNYYKLYEEETIYLEIICNKCNRYSSIDTNKNIEKIECSHCGNIGFIKHQLKEYKI